MSNLNIKNLIVGVDLSDYSKIVVKEARNLSKKLSIPAVFVYVFEDIAIFDTSFSYEKPKLNSFYEKKVRQKYRLKKEDKVLVCYGRPHIELIETAKKYTNPMIIAGHKGRNPIVRLFIGSTAEQLALLSPFPTWIHRGRKQVLPKQILVACDLSARTSRTIQGLKFFKDKMQSKLELLHVFAEPTPLLDAHLYGLLYEQMKQADDRKVKTFKKKYPDLKTRRSWGTVADRIQTVAKDYDLIAISPRKQRNSAPQFSSVTTKVIRSGEKPVLVLPT